MASTEMAPITAHESALIMNDLAKLSGPERIAYYKNVCDSVGLNPLTQPFEYVNLNGKLRLYAKRDATEQLRKIHGITVTISSREKVDGLYIVTARAKDAAGRQDESIGAVSIEHLKGESLANALMKAESKAKRRVTLSIAGLGLLDETEIESIPKEQIEPTAKIEMLTQIEEKKEGVRLTIGQKQDLLKEILKTLGKDSTTAFQWIDGADESNIDDQIKRFKEQGVIK